MTNDIDVRLRQYIERIERAEFEKTQLLEELRDIKKEMKSEGYDLKAVNEVLKRRKKGREKVVEEDTIIHLYEKALGMLEG